MSDISFIAKIKKFSSEVQQEIKKVTFPARRETVLTTVFVSIFSVIASIYFLITDKIIISLLAFIRGF